MRVSAFRLDRWVYSGKLHIMSDAAGTGPMSMISMYLPNAVPYLELWDYLKASISQAFSSTNLKLQRFSIIRNTMVNVAVAGGTGGVGRTIVEALGSSRHQAFVLSRKVPSPLMLHYTQYYEPLIMSHSLQIKLKQSQSTTATLTASSASSKHIKSTLSSRPSLSKATRLRSRRRT
jgi:hypothetical protein